MAQIEILAFNAMPLADLLGLAEFLVHRAEKRGLSGVERYTILRPLGSRQGRHDVGQIEVQTVRENRIRRIRGAPHALGFSIGLDERDALGLAARGRQIVDRPLINREEAARRTIFGRHIGNSGAVSDGHVIEPRTVELDELSDHAPLAQHLRHRQHEIGCSDAFFEPAGQLEAYHLRQQHRDLLAEHHGLGLDTSHAPSQHGQTIDHRGV